MARVKNEAVRQAILNAAASQIAQTSYMDTTIAKIAKGAGIVPSNVYIYFESKLQIYFEIYGQWLRSQMARLERAVARSATPEDKMRRLVHGLLFDMADDQTGYTSALMEALAIVSPKDKYDPKLLGWTESKIVEIVCSSLDGVDATDPRLRGAVHLLMLTFDGVALRVKALRAFDQTDATMGDVENTLIEMLLNCSKSTT